MFKIRKVKAFLTAPDGIDLLVVKVETDEPGLYGWGCATFTQRCLAVKTVIDEYLSPLLEGRDPQQIEEIWQLCNVNAYWRNGPVLNNAMAGVDMALWDIKGKIAGMPVYQLFGGKCREAAAAYVHTNSPVKEVLLEKVRKKMEEGYRYIRCQAGFYGGAEAGVKPENAPQGDYYDPKKYIRKTVEMLDYIRTNTDSGLEIIHDVHERLYPSDALALAKEVEEFHLYFLEDPVSPEQSAWLRRCRQQCVTPIGLGELLNNPAEWKDLVCDRLIDFIRIHISQAGGLTPARKIAEFASLFQVRTAWHGPGDVSPVGHAANLHLNLSSPNFGVQEWTEFSPAMYQVFEGIPEVRNGYIYANERPGLGIEFHENAAKAYPPVGGVVEWTQARLPDGTIFTP